MKHENFFSKIGFNYLILAIISILCQLIVVNVFGHYNYNLLNDINFLSIISSICNYLLPFPIFYYLMKKLEKRKISKNKVNLKTFILYIGITITLMWIGNLIGIAITQIIGTAIQNEVTNPVEQLISNSDIMVNLIIISIIAPIFEEIIFRKILIDRSIKYGARVSIILSATLFALFHGNLNQFFYAFLMGGFFAYVYIKTGKIIYTIILHLIINLMGSVISLIVANAFNNLITSINLTDILILIIYLAFLVAAICIGIIGLSRYNSAKLNYEKTEIDLKTPLRTMLLNPGMILFIIFFIFEIILSTLGIV